MNTDSNNGGGNNGGGNASSTASYDFGTGGSPLFSGYTRITPTSGNWTNTSGLNSRDRGAGPNALNRDFIFSSNTRTFEHNVPNGTYDVTVTFGDKDYSRNGQAVKAEGVTKSFSDGKLSLEFSTTSGVWCVNRVTINPASGGGNNGGNNGGNQVAGSYDLGTGNSPLFSEYTRITPSSGNWTNTSGLNSRDRGTGPNALNRDFIFSANARTFEHTTGNGSYDVTVTFGDRDYSRTGQAIKAEGTTVISGFNTNKNQFRNATFQTTVNDGKLSLEFSASTGVWCVTRIVINPVRANLAANSKELKRDLIIKAYPNPTFDIVQVNADNVSSLKVRNLAGQIVLRNTKQSSIDIRNLNNGIYILEVSVDGDDRVISQKIVKN